MNFLNDELINKIVLLTWRNPAFMAVAIALIWLIPQLIIRKIMANQIETIKLKKQKEKIRRLYPDSFK